MLSTTLNERRGKTMARSEHRVRREEPKMKGGRRRARLIELIGEDSAQRASVNELASVLGVSVATIRRDLAQLEKDQLISRLYGGAALAPAKRELTMAQRQVSNAEAKRAIAQAAVSLIHEGDLVILDAGSTAEQIAVAFDNRFEITVVTNGVRCINQLIPQDKVHVLVLGGNLRGVNETICGADAEMALSRIYGTLAFIGADALDSQRGVASRTYDQSRLKSLMLRGASNAYVIADSSKLDDGTDLPYWSPLPAQWGLITDAAAPEKSLDALEECGAVSILLADKDKAKERI